MLLFFTCLKFSCLARVKSQNCLVNGLLTLSQMKNFGLFQNGSLQTAISDLLKMADSFLKG